jgi:hypothetical protein
VLGERQKRVLRILRIGTHLEISRGDSGGGQGGQDVAARCIRG